MTSTRVAPASIGLIDPVVGTSAGTLNADVHVKAGDIVVFRFAYNSVPVAANRGIQTYLTNYLPPNTELVGVRITDAAGNTVEPRYPGLALDGCGGGAFCNSVGGFQSGSIAQVYADTGVFFATDSRLARTPSDALITVDNGTQIDFPAQVTDLASVFGGGGSPYFAHNSWDALQVRAFGASTSTFANGDGNTPHRYGSCVAGADTHYRYEATAAGGTVDLVSADGPWNRVRYPGSLTGVGVGDIGATTNMTRVAIATLAGTDLTPATAVAALAVRIALGEVWAGDQRFVEVALRVTGLPLDPAVASGGGNVICAETLTGDISSKASNNGGMTNPWPTYLGSPSCGYVRIAFELDANKQLAVATDTVSYSLRGRNLSTSFETNARAELRYTPTYQSFGSSSPAPSAQGSCTDDASKQCLQWNLGTLAPSATIDIDASFTVLAGGQAANVVQAIYRSDQNPGFTTEALTVATPTARPQITLDLSFDPTQTFASAGASTTIVGEVANLGTESWTSEQFVVYLPLSTWSVTGFTVGTSSASCTTTGIQRVCSLNLSYAPGQSRAITFNIVVPATTTAGLYPIGIATRGSQPVVGSFETFFPNAVHIPVTRPRTAPPILACPIRSVATSIAGTAEPSASVAVRFNALDRGSTTASAGGAWSATNYTAFGSLYPGLEVTAVATSPAKLPSVPSFPCIVSTQRLAITPATTTSPPRGEVAFSASGGSDTGFVWSLLTNASGGSIDTSTGAYTAGPVGNVTDVVEVIDSIGKAATATVNVSVGITITPPAATLAPHASVTFTAQGGSATGFVWSFATNASGGTIDPATGQYTAGATPNVTDIVQVTDSLGNTAMVSIAIGASVSISPSSATTPPRGAVAFTAAAGDGSYTWSLPTNASGGTISTTGGYVAGSTGSVTDVVQLMDSVGNTAMVAVTVGPGITITPATTQVSAAASVAFSASGGSGTGLQWSIVTNASGSTIVGSTGAYTAGTQSGADIVHVIDSLGNAANATVTVVASSSVDAGVADAATQADAGRTPDAGQPVDDGDDGCGCRSSTPRGMWLPLMLVVCALRRRRRPAAELKHTTS